MQDIKHFSTFSLPSPHSGTFSALHSLEKRWLYLHAPGLGGTLVAEHGDREHYANEWA